MKIKCSPPEEIQTETDKYCISYCKNCEIKNIQKNYSLKNPNGSNLGCRFTIKPTESKYSSDDDPRIL